MNATLDGSNVVPLHTLIKSNATVAIKAEKVKQSNIIFCRWVYPSGVEIRAETRALGKGAGFHSYLSYLEINTTLSCVVCV